MSFLTKRLLIKDRKYAESSEGILEGHKEKIIQTSRDLGLNLQIEICRDAWYELLPRGYDGYLLHLSDIDQSDLFKLRKEQPWSWIFTIFRGGRVELTKELRDASDRVFSAMSRGEYEEVARRMQSYRTSEKGEEEK
jgi:hypothetical protein